MLYLWGLSTGDFREALAELLGKDAAGLSATSEQRDWVHKLKNILDKLPKRLQSRATAVLHEFMYGETRAQVRQAATRFAIEYGPKYPKAVTLEKGCRHAADVLRLPWKNSARAPGIASLIASVIAVLALFLRSHAYHLGCGDIPTARGERIRISAFRAMHVILRAKAIAPTERGS